MLEFPISEEQAQLTAENKIIDEKRRAKKDNIT